MTFPSLKILSSKSESLCHCVFTNSKLPESLEMKKN
jgi:hypothetical protein